MDYAESFLVDIGEYVDEDNKRQRHFASTLPMMHWKYRSRSSECSLELVETIWTGYPARDRAAARQYVRSAEERFIRVLCALGISKAACAQ